MSSRLNPDTAVAIAKKALTAMARQNVPLSPENYFLWLGHMIGVKEELDADIRRIIEGGGAFSEEINADLFRRHFGKDTGLKLVQDAQQEIRKILEEVLERILQTEHSTSDYCEKLKGLMTQLKGARDLAGIQKVISELMLITVVVIRTSEQIKERMVETKAKSENLQKDLEKAQQEMLTDPLTSLYNRKAIDNKISAYLKFFQEEGIGFSAIMIDIDHFKKFNDLHGHLLGDQILKFIGSLLSKEIKGRDFVGRYGGEEFIILLSDTPLEKACIVADNIRRSLDRVQLKYVKTGQNLGKITVSAGISAARSGDTEESLIKRADDALYLAKRCGRNTLKSEQDLSGNPGTPAMARPLTVEFAKG
jgi:diguanylate cyclase